MKSDFHVDKNLMQLEEVLSAKDPYAILVVSTTGLDNKDCDKHSPTRVQLVQYEFDDELKQYGQSITFNKLVAADIEAVNYAIETAKNGGYDTFASAEIDPVSYKNQVENPDLGKNGGIPADQKVFTQEEFKQAFEYAMQGLMHENTTIIANGYEHSQKYLAKIGCGEQLQQMQEKGKVIDQPHLGGEFLNRHGRDDLTKAGTATLENVRNFIAPVSPIIKQFEQADIAKDFSTMSKKDFLEAHNISEHAYDMKVSDNERRNAKATAPERKDVINGMITTIGREKELLESERMSRMRQNESQRFGMASERGKKKYQNASVSQKLNTQIEMGLIDRDAVLDGDSEYHRLMSAIHGDNGNKGVIFVHVATSGFNNPMGNKTGMPMQIVVRAIEIDPNGKGMIISPETAKGVKATMKLPPEVVLKAEEEIKNGGFDVFKDAGIAIDDMKNGVNTIGEARFVKAVEDIFQKYSPDEYAIIALNGGKDDEKAFFQKALESICTFDVINAPVIDFTKATSAYSLLTVEGEIPDNKIFGDAPTKGLGIRDVATAIGRDLSDGTSSKILTMAQASDVLYQQYLELNPELLNQKEEVKETSEEKAEKETSPAPSETLDDFTEVDTENPDAEAEFADEDESYDNTYVEDDIDADREAFEDSLIESEIPEAPVADKKPEQTPPEKKEEKAEEAQEPVRRHPERRKLHEESERPRRIAPAPEAPKENSDMASLVAALIQQNTILVQQNTQQNAIIAKQSEIIAGHEKSLCDIIQQQNDLLKSIVADRPHAHVKETQKVVPLKPLEGSVIDKLEQIKDRLNEISDEVSDKVKECLKDANASISEGQAELEEPQKAIDPRPVA